MISLNGLMLDGSIVGYALLAFAVIFEIMLCVAIVNVIILPRQLKKYQARTEAHMVKLEQELNRLNAALETERVDKAGDS